MLFIFSMSAGDATRASAEYSTGDSTRVSVGAAAVSIANTNMNTNAPETTT